MAAIKMRTMQNKEAVCDNCGCPYGSTEEMYQIKICSIIYTLCKDCIDRIFHITLSATCAYNKKVKSKEDLKRQKAAWKRRLNVESND